MESASSRKKLLFLSPSVSSGKECECVVEDFESISNKAIGEGAFGQVFKVRHIKTGGFYAIKMISKLKILEKNMLAQLRREVRIMYSVDHPNIIKLFNHFEDDKNFYLILQLAEGGSLFNKLVKCRSFDAKESAQYLREVALAVQYLHSRDPPIIHRDIKPENIFLDKDGKAKLGDFGWSSFSDNVRSTYCGTLEYLAPEMIDRLGHDTRLDIWNLGVLLFELLTGNAPFQSQHQEELFSKIKALKVGFPKNFPTEAKDLVRGLLKSNPEERITIKQLLEHPWIKQHPPLRKTVEMTTVIQKSPEDLNIPDEQYKVISKADGTPQLLIQEKILGTQLRTKIKRFENEIYQLENVLKKTQEKVMVAEKNQKGLKESIESLRGRLRADQGLEDSKVVFSENQEDLDDKIVKIQVKIRKIEFELRLKVKENIEKKKKMVSNEIRMACSENLLINLKNYSKEMRYFQKNNKTSSFPQELKQIIFLLNDDSQDDLVRFRLEELTQKMQEKIDIEDSVEEVNGLVKEKCYRIKEIEEEKEELSKVIGIKSVINQKLFGKKEI